MADQPDPQLEATEPVSPPEPAHESKALLAQRRRRWLTILVVVVVVVGLLATLYHFVIGVRHVSTDNAYVGADSASVTPLVAAPVESVRVANTQIVHKGDILVTLDPADMRIAAERAAADYAQAQRQFQETRATGGALQAQITARDSDIQRAQADLTTAQAQYDKARVDYDRRMALAKAGAVSGDEITATRTVLAQAKSQLDVVRAAIAQANATRMAARQSYAANQALVQGSMYDNPDVAAARARYDQAKLDLSRTVIHAPFDGVVSQRNVQIGQRVAAGTQLMVVVPLNTMYVDANYKEGQLRRVKIGQPARLTSDLYGGGIVYHGRVVGLSGGTGSAFALIPAQNATGNWIKVVQRLPVRIQLDPNELTQHPLRVGLSMTATIDVD
ncbi:HlyD family efflux transporter periplasmic adaptor subunit [Sphingomonas nostoxanthinifaciens]|uniref:HlyD family efflux transporter periplasmic adaptor subunit n=1 Tax=Sphingomonas nostoxanthinifaciens TaxID=2872652 RepID=UPI001CC21E05|nr:HlyD family efflux transporter periplasmic adaptor subunit [Sphingomonas nostoxanthinifaciens]UAK24298.1 HlyD family efflux transporter periplasmic adaptor subunit [Sphingomonas nostoxanthinifaciens]